MLKEFFLNELNLSTSKLSFHTTIVSITISAVFILGLSMMIYIPRLQAQSSDSSIIGCAFLCLDSRGYGYPDLPWVNGYDLTAHGILGRDIQMWIYPTAHPRTVPLYEYVNQYDVPSISWVLSPIHVHKFYYSTKILDLSNYGYKLVGVAGYIYPLNTPEGARPRTVSLQEFFEPRTGVYSYATNGLPVGIYEYATYPTGEVGYVFEHREPGAMLLRTYEIQHIVNRITPHSTTPDYALKTFFYSIHPDEINQLVEDFKTCDPIVTPEFGGCP